MKQYDECKLKSNVFNKRSAVEHTHAVGHEPLEDQLDSDRRATWPPDSFVTHSRAPSGNQVWGNQSTDHYQDSVHFKKERFAYICSGKRKSNEVTSSYPKRDFASNNGTSDNISPSPPQVPSFTNSTNSPTNLFDQESSEDSFHAATYCDQSPASRSKSPSWDAPQNGGSKSRGSKSSQNEKNQAILSWPEPVLLRGVIKTRNRFLGVPHNNQSKQPRTEETQQSLIIAPRAEPIRAQIQPDEPKLESDSNVSLRSSIPDVASTISGNLSLPNSLFSLHLPPSVSAQNVSAETERETSPQKNQQATPPRRHSFYMYRKKSKLKTDISVIAPSVSPSHSVASQVFVSIRDAPDIPMSPVNTTSRDTDIGSDKTELDELGSKTESPEKRQSNLNSELSVGLSPSPNINATQSRSQVMFDSVMDTIIQAATRLSKLKLDNNNEAEGRKNVASKKTNSTGSSVHSLTLGSLKDQPNQPMNLNIQSPMVKQTSEQPRSRMFAESLMIEL